MIEIEEDWKGYTLEELRFRRIVNLTKIEIEKTALSTKVAEATNPQNTASSLIGRFMGAFNYLDYALLAFRIGKKIYKFFKK